MFVSFTLTRKTVTHRRTKIDIFFIRTHCVMPCLHILELNSNKRMIISIEWKYSKASETIQIDRIHLQEFIQEYIKAFRQLTEN